MNLFHRPLCSARRSLGLALALFAAALPGALSAQSAALAGRVTDANNGRPLAGATIQLEGTTHQTTTDRDGFYSLRRLEAGPVTVVVNYLGYDPRRLGAQLSDGQTTTLDAVVGQEIVELEEFVVEGFVEGQARALSLQRAALNITNIISSDSVGQFPDKSVPDALRRLPGISIERGDGEGEGRYVTVRGLNADFNGVAINGVRATVSNFDGASRSVPLDVVATKGIESIEVTKAVRPDQDADSIGGLIEIRTRSAFDRQGRFLSVDAAGFYNDLAGDYGAGFYVDDWGWEASASYGDFLNAAKTLGLSLTINARSNPYVSQSGGVLGWTQVIDGPGILADKFVPTGFVLQEYFDEVDAVGFNGSLEYRPENGDRFRLTAGFTERESRRGRQRQEIRFDPDYFYWDDAAPIEVTGDTVTRFTADNRLFRQIRDFYETQQLLNTVIDGRLQRGDGTWEWAAGFNRGSFDGDPDKDLWLTFRSGFGFNDYAYNADQPYAPDFAAEVNRNDPTRFRLTSADLGTRYITDDELMARLDYRHDTEIFGLTGFWKVGVQARTRDRDYETVDRFFDSSTNNVSLNSGSALAWWLDVGLDGGDAITRDYGPASSVNGNYSYGFFLDPARAREVTDFLLGDGRLAFNPDGLLDSQLRSLTGSYDASEDVTSTYLMAQVQEGPWSLLAGARLEATRTEFNTYAALVEDGFFTSVVPVQGKSDYVDVMPGVHVRYEFSENFQLKASLNRTIARPSYRQLNPTTRVDRNAADNEYTVIRGRTDLEPTASTNVDLTLEYYFGSVGLVSASVFYKDMSDNVYQLEDTIPASEVPGAVAGDPLYSLLEWRNAEGAEVLGLELNFERNLRFLPAPFDGFGVFANFTWVDSKVDTGLPERVGLETPLFGQVGTSYNVGLFYEKHGLRTRVAYNWRDDYLAFNGLNSNPLLDNYITRLGELDVTASYDLPKGFTIFAQFINVTDSPDRSFAGSELRPRYNEYRGWKGTFGVRWRL